MKTPNLHSVKDAECIFSNGIYVVISGKNLWIFGKDGSFIAKLSTVRNVYNMMFVTDHTALIDDHKGRAYHYVSLETGEIIWTCPQKGRRMITPRAFAVFDDKKTVYFVYRNYKEKVFVDVLNLNAREIVSYALPEIRGAIRGCGCDADGNLLLLQTKCVEHYSDYGDDQSYLHGAIMLWAKDSPSLHCSYQWKTQTGAGNCPIAFNDEYILLNSFTALHRGTAEEIKLVEHLPANGMDSMVFRLKAYDTEQKLMTLWSVENCSTIIVDCKKRKIVAHYVPITRGQSGGCLIDNEFWIGTAEGVIKRPFPHMDPFPKAL